MSINHTDQSKTAMQLFYTDFNISIINNIDLDSTYFFTIFLGYIYIVVFAFDALNVFYNFLNFSSFSLKEDKL